MSVLKPRKKWACSAVRGWLVLLVFQAACFAQDNKEYIPRPGQFPPSDAGRYVAGELVTVDPVNRRGVLRLDGDPNHYEHEALHPFAMLPYGMIWYNGAPAELRDVPIGTHLHGYFFLPPQGEEATISALKGAAGFSIPQNHAISLEDDFSFYQRRGQAWKVVSLDAGKGKIQVVSAGPSVRDGLSGARTFDIDATARIWKDRRLVEMTDIAAGQTVQINFTWTGAWAQGELGVCDIWLDEASRDFATEFQRRRHIKYEHVRWMPGWVDQVEHNDFGGGIVTVTLFGGMDPSLYEELKGNKEKGFGVAVAEKTLRTWSHRTDKKIGQVIEWKEIANPPLGSAGIQLRLKFTELLDGYRPGRIVRVKSDSWTFITIPFEERMKSLDER